jgi:hypothetical protein
MKINELVPDKTGQIAAIAMTKQIILTSNRSRPRFFEAATSNEFFDSARGLNRDRPPAV